MAETITKQCPICGKDMLHYVNWADKYNLKTCSKSCGAILQMRDPERKKKMYSKEVREKISIGLKKWHKTPEGKIQTVKATKTLMEYNKTHKEEMTQKMRTTKRLKGTLNVFLGVRGGNGHLTEPKKLLAVALGWKMEVAISLGKLKKGYPTNYKVDIANQTLKIAIEVDGKGHLLKKNILKDIKKTKMLESLGWKVLRYTNKEIMNDVSKVLLAIKKEIKDMSLSTISK